jgi:transcriptional regulator with XRE-family HTH domain
MVRPKQKAREASPAPASDALGLDQLKEQGLAVGAILLKNLHRLGHAKVVVNALELSRLCEAAGVKMNKQRISRLMNSFTVEPATIEALARAVGVPPSELLRRGD